MPLDLRQAVVEGACPHCGGKVALRWSRTSEYTEGRGFAHGRCLSCGDGWYAGSYATCPVEDFASPLQALVALQALSGEGVG